MTRVITYSPKVFIPADEALPRHLPLLHVRAAAVRGERAYMTADALDRRSAVVSSMSPWGGRHRTSTACGSFGAPPLAEPLNPSVNDSALRRPARLVRPGLAVQPAR